MENIGAIITAYRKKAHISQTELAEKLLEEGIEVSQKSISAWETGRNEVSARIFLHICRILEIPDCLEEYFGSNPNDEWAEGLRRELALDRLNGFVGKTAVHPSQIPVIYESMKVSESDYNDAVQILNWQPDSLGVSKSNDGSRMNEVKCHSKWARRIKIMGDIYGIREQ